MVRGLYTAYTGMRNEQNRMDIISNNLANVSTAGYKEENVASQAFDKVFALKIRDVSESFNDRRIGTMSLGVKVGEVYTDYRQGSVRETGNTYDLAIDGKGFFRMRVTNRAGEDSMKLTRDGNFKITRDGNIVDAYGNHLQGEAGDLIVPTDAVEVRVYEDGQVYADGEYVDRILIVDYEDYDYIEKFGDNMYQTVEGATEREDFSGRLLQGYIEQSNVNSVSEMVELITVTRAYEAGQKIIQSTDDMLDLAANSVGKV